MFKKIPSKLVSKAIPKKILGQNTESLKSYDDYKKTADLIERVDVAMGRKLAYKAITDSTLNFNIKAHGIYSTTAYKI